MSLCVVFAESIPMMRLLVQLMEFPPLLISCMTLEQELINELQYGADSAAIVQRGKGA